MESTAQQKSPYLDKFHTSNSRSNLGYNLPQIFHTPASRNIANKKTVFGLRCRTFYFFTLKELIINTVRNQTCTELR